MWLFEPGEIIVAYDGVEGFSSPAIWQVREVRDANRGATKPARWEYRLRSRRLSMWMSELELRERNVRRATDAEKAVFRLGGV